MAETADAIIEELKTLGHASIKKVLLNHGAQEPLFGVKVEDLKKIQKRIKQDYQLALDLFATGIYDAMYLAGLIADDQRMTKRDLQRWLKQAPRTLSCGSTVPWVTAGSKFGRELALEWIDSKQESSAAAGWATLSSLVSIQDDSELDLDELRQLLQRVQQTIHSEPNEVRSSMNGFVISLGTYVKDLTELAIQAGTVIGKVSVDKGKTECKVPDAVAYIQKAQQRGTIGKKRKSAKC
ncbi:MAG: alkylation repair protein [Planctomycetaceae bacterium]|nr:alkylation repair protein [Planctomycetaceae bacterium]